ncbi:MAG: phytanoyl-CoA dioxygenase family protein [Actinomycetota bacterium]
MNNYWAFHEMRDSAHAIDDSATLREILAADGYLYLPGVLDPQKVLDLRRDVVGVLDAAGWFMPGSDAMLAKTTMRPVREGDDEYFVGYDGIQRLEKFHTLAHDPALSAVMQAVLGPSAFPHPLKVARLVFPDHHEISTPPHQDFPNNQGTPSLTACWIPLGDCPVELGSLSILEGSHRLGVLPLQFGLGPGNRQVVLPRERMRDLRWVTTDFAAGDVLIFGSMTVHASLHNADLRRMRLSVDYRYQPVDEPLTDLVLQPHFGRLSWDEIYAGWDDDQWQHYWRDLDLTVETFDHSRHTVGEPTEEDYADVLRYQHRLSLHDESTPAAQA